MPGVVPVNAKPYRYSPLHKDKIEKQVKTLLQNGLIVASTSPFASPVLLVQKKDGSWCFCVDYRRLNSITIKNKFPIPLIDEILDELARAQFFSKLDLRAGFHQIRMASEDEFKTAPATFQCNMNHILKLFLRRFVIVFMDDILVYSHSLQWHAIHLQRVLSVLKQHHYFVKLSKCEFAQQKLEYLGHIISSVGVSTDPKKTQAMREWHVPASTTELRGFLGLTRYYRKFVKDYGSIANPLTNLLKKKQFVWSTAAQTTFDRLKSAISSTPMLAFPDFNKPFMIETDASDIGFGAVLMQDDKPMTFISKPLSVTHKSLSIYEK
jgi:hypothetical protein